MRRGHVRGAAVTAGPVRRAAVAGSWYPATPEDLATEVDDCLERASNVARSLTRIVGVVVPHAGLMYSGRVAAYAYRRLRDLPFETAVLVGPSHFVGFDGVACYGSGSFETPLGPALIDREVATALLAAMRHMRDDRQVHGREHSLELQLPFLKRIAPRAEIVPLLVGYQTADIARELGDALAAVLRGRSAVLVASTDLSHYHPAPVAGRMDAVVLDCLERLDPDGLQSSLERQPEHACGGGAAVAVMRAARQLGATRGEVLRYADSGDVSGDKSSVVGYAAAALGS